MQTSVMADKYPLNQRQIDYFVSRTNQHIARVKKNAKRLAAAFPEIKSPLLLDAKTHDASKFEEDEYFAYVWLTSVYNLGYKYPDKELEHFVAEAWVHHYTVNPHHPEYWGTNGRHLEEMPDYQLAHMVCDWASMSQEKQDSLLDWWHNKASKRFKFSAHQKKQIEKYLAEFKELL